MEVLMKRRTVTKQVGNVTPEEFKQLYSLNLRNEGAMRFDLVDYRKSDPKTTHVIMIKEGPKVLAWALVFPKSSYKKNRLVYFYTRQSHRRQGLGTRLLKHSRKLDPVPEVCPHDKRSGAFFKKFRGTVKWEDFGGWTA
jgi:hypothetical protein